MSGGMLVLLGVHWGQFSERWDIERRSIVSEAESEATITDGKYVMGFSGMTCVAPAWELLELIETLL